MVTLLMNIKTVPHLPHTTLPHDNGIFYKVLLLQETDTPSPFYLLSILTPKFCSLFLADKKMPRLKLLATLLMRRDSMNTIDMDAGKS